VTIECGVFAGNRSKWIFAKALTVRNTVIGSFIHEPHCKTMVDIENFFQRFMVVGFRRQVPPVNSGMAACGNPSLGKQISPNTITVSFTGSALLRADVMPMIKFTLVSVASKTARLGWQALTKLVPTLPRLLCQRRFWITRGRVSVPLNAGRKW
jgi:hypothetical protein